MLFRLPNILTASPTPQSPQKQSEDVLRKNSFKAVVKKKKPLLSVRHRKARLAFAQKYRE